MIKRIISFAVASGLLLSGCAQRQQSIAENNKQSSETNSEQVSLPLLRNVSYHSLSALPYTDSSIKLHYGADQLQYGKLYLPPATSLQLKAPLLVFIHGGCWLSTYDINHSRAFSQAVAADGFAVWSLEYRRTGDVGGGWPGSFTDVLQGLRFAKNGLNAFAVNSSNIIIAGHSAGGQLALLAAGQSYHQPDTEVLPPIKGVIGLAAITDMVAYAKGDNSCQRATRQFLGGTADEQPERYLHANPQYQTSHPSALLLHGAADNIVPLDQANESGMRFKIIADAGHFDWIHPHTNAYKQFITTLQELFAQ